MSNNLRDSAKENVMKDIVCTIENTEIKASWEGCEASQKLLRGRNAIGNERENRKHEKQQGRQAQGPTDCEYGALMLSVG